jgi:peptide deformylase
MDGISQRDRRRPVGGAKIRHDVVTVDPGGGDCARSPGSPARQFAANSAPIAAPSQTGHVRVTALGHDLFMTLLTILRYPDPRLHTVARPVAEVDARIRQLADDMVETMYANDGVGLAATQVDVHERLLVMDTSTERNRPRVLINPEIVWRSDELALGEEGCLSVPQIYDRVQRHARVRVRALGRDGQPFEFEAEGLESVCVQHEMDHLMGKVFVEYLSPLKRDRIRQKMLKRTREEQVAPGRG